MNTRLEVRGLRTNLIGPVEFNLSKGETVCLTGPSGSGKTLLLRAVADLDPHEGRMFLDGKESTEFPACHWRKQVAFLTTESAWWGNVVGDHLRTADGSLLEELGFEEDILNWSVQRLSAGERQRLALARLLENSPKVLLLDEPTAHLDAESKGRVEDVLRRFQQATSAAFLWVTHDQDQTRRFGKRLFMMKNGALKEVRS